MSNVDDAGLSPSQCRAARALLGWSQTDLEQRAAVARKTLADFEAGKRQPYQRTLADIRRVLEEAGISFVPAGNYHGVGGSGVRLRDDEHAGR